MSQAVPISDQFRRAHPWLVSRLQIARICRGGLFAMLPASALLLWFGIAVTDTTGVGVAVVPVTCAAAAAIGIVMTSALISHLLALIDAVSAAGKTKQRHKLVYKNMRVLRGTVVVTIDDRDNALMGPNVYRAQVHDLTSVEIVGDLDSGLFGVRVGDGFVYSRRRNASKPEITA